MELIDERLVDGQIVAGRMTAAARSSVSAEGFTKEDVGARAHVRPDQPRHHAGILATYLEARLWRGARDRQALRDPIQNVDTRGFLAGARTTQDDRDKAQRTPDLSPTIAEREHAAPRLLEVS